MLVLGTFLFYRSHLPDPDIGTLWIASIGPDLLLLYQTIVESTNSFSGGTHEISFRLAGGPVRILYGLAPPRISYLLYSSRPLGALDLLFHSCAVRYDRGVLTLPRDE